MLEEQYHRCKTHRTCCRGLSCESLSLMPMRDPGSSGASCRHVCAYHGYHRVGDNCPDLRSASKMTGAE
jgi:hypothetical protein